MILLVINDTIYQYFPDSDNVTHKVIATLTTCDTKTTFKGIQPRKMFTILNLCNVCVCVCVGGGGGGLICAH